ncbi:MAG: hypothetical protein JWN44_930 [Myxococcales bacterium]|nr:hypothetical protein [Myxococcales bacterium]
MKVSESGVDTSELRSRGAGTTSEDAYEIALEAYTYLYPLVLMEVTRKQMTNCERPDEEGHAPLNAFSHLRAFPSADNKLVVRPNADTLYSIAWLDLASEPVILSVPSSDRYYLLPMLDMWTDVFACAGTRTTGNGAGLFAIVGPDGADASLPEQAELIDSPTRFVFVIGRTQANGPSDYPNVHRLQDALALAPLSQWARKSVPIPGKVDASVDMRTPAVVQVANLDLSTFFRAGCRIMEDNAPHFGDQPILARLRRLGLTRGARFELAKLGSEMTGAVERGVKDAKHSLATKFERDHDLVNNWVMKVEDMGAYGSDYLQRASVAFTGLGANLPADAVYPVAFMDSEGRPFDGQSRYVVHFDQAALPPARAFWSLTLYGEDQFFYDNPLGRHAIGDRDALKYNNDGSLDLYVQHESPGADKAANWLPAPANRFTLLLRMYWPKPSVLNGMWSPPPVRRVDRSTVH